MIFHLWETLGMGAHDKMILREHSQQNPACRRLVRKNNPSSLAKKIAKIEMKG